MDKLKVKLPRVPNGGRLRLKCTVSYGTSRCYITGRGKERTGHHMVNLDGTSDHKWSIIGATKPIPPEKNR